MKSRQPLFAAAALAGALFLFAGSPRDARAYVLEGPKWPTGRTVSLQMALGSAGRTLLDGNSSWDTAAIAAPGVWNGFINRMQFSAVVNPSAPLSSGDGINTAAFSSTVFGQAFGNYTLAVTYYRYSGSTMMEADVLFNNHQIFDSYRGALHFGGGGAAIADIRRVFIHELGHALGLNHPDQHGQNVSAIMNSVISNIETTTSDDINGAQSLYGAGQPSPTPTPTPSPNPTPTPSPTATPNPTPTPIPTPTPPSLPTVRLSASTTSVRTGGSSTYTATVSFPNPTSAVTVSYSMSGSAIQGTQYSLNGSPGQFTIPAGATSATVTLNVLSAPRRAKTATMTLTSGTGYTLGNPKTASVSIRR